MSQVQFQGLILQSSHCIASSMSLVTIKETIPQGEQQLQNLAWELFHIAYAHHEIVLPQ